MGGPYGVPLGLCGDCQTCVHGLKRIGVTAVLVWETVSAYTPALWNSL